MDDFEEHVKSAALEVAPAEVRHRPDWFTEVEEILMKFIDSRNQAFKANMKHPSTENLQALKQARHTLLREKRRAKRQWQLEYANKCKKSDFCLSPKDAWKMVFNLMEGFTTHHRVFRPTNFKSRNGIKAMTAIMPTYLILISAHCSIARSKPIFQYLITFRNMR